MGFNARMSRNVYSVTRLNQEVRASIEGNFGAQWVEGELSNFARPASGHWYFTLKDPSAQVRCAMFKPKAGLVRFRPADGMQVLVYARISLYEPRGEFQLVAEHMEPAGEGLLRLRFEQLKQQLAAEGLFDTDRKRPLPAWPRGIGVVTSATGAALRDILHVLARRNPSVPVYVYPCAVQGTAAASELAAAVDSANRHGHCDVLIVARGGGSLEDLWSFNEEKLVRAVAASRIPVVSGVGHETDFTLCDFAADVRAPTPSAAAEICVPDRQEVLRRFAALERRLAGGFGNYLRLQRQRLQALAARLVHPGRRIEQHQQRLDELLQRLPAALDRRLGEHRARLLGLEARLRGAAPTQRLLLARTRLAGAEQRLHATVPRLLNTLQGRVLAAERTLQALSPLATLQRGYAILQQADGSVVRDAGQVAPGEALAARLARGELTVEVVTREPGQPVSGNTT